LSRDGLLLLLMYVGAGHRQAQCISWMRTSIPWRNRL